MGITINFKGTGERTAVKRRGHRPFRRSHPERDHRGRASVEATSLPINTEREKEKEEGGEEGNAYEIGQACYLIPHGRRKRHQRRKI